MDQALRSSVRIHLTTIDNLDGRTTSVRCIAFSASSVN